MFYNRLKKLEERILSIQFIEKYTAAVICEVQTGAKLGIDFLFHQPPGVKIIMKPTPTTDFFMCDIGGEPMKLIATDFYKFPPPGMNKTQEELWHEKYCKNQKAKDIKSFVKTQQK